MKPLVDLRLRRRQPDQGRNVHERHLGRERTVHERLSHHQAAYAVFVPKPDDFFNLFEVIFLHHDRPRSPRNTNTNLREIFEDHYSNRDDETGYDKRMVEAFLEQFEKVTHRDIDDYGDQEKNTRDPETISVSEESLRRAGFEVSSPGPRLGGEASKISTVYRQIRLSWLSSDSYTGRKNLQKLIWKHAETVFLLILQELDGRYFSTEVGNRSLMGTVTKRLISKVGVSQVDEKGARAFMGADSGALPADLRINMGGESIKVLREVYDDLYGVSGLHFIAFPVERLDRHRWRFYKGIDVCDAELDDNASQDLLRRDDFYQAGLWLHGAGGAETGSSNDCRTVTEEHSTRSRTSKQKPTLHGRMGEGPDHVDVTNRYQTAPFVNIDIRPYLSEFAYKQCKLAAYYRKADRNNSEKTAHAVSILRSALRKCCFESTVRALYDFSGCYHHGIGVEADNVMGKLLRYCAGGMRRSYSSRYWWLTRLMMEVGIRFDDAPERNIAAMALLSRWRLVGSHENTRSYLCREGSDRIGHPLKEDIDDATDRSQHSITGMSAMKIADPRLSDSRGNVMPTSVADKRRYDMDAAMSSAAFAEGLAIGYNFFGMSSIKTVVQNLTAKVEALRCTLKDVEERLDATRKVIEALSIYSLRTLRDRAMQLLGKHMAATVRNADAVSILVASVGGILNAVTFNGRKRRGVKGGIMNYRGFIAETQSEERIFYVLSKMGDLSSITGGKIITACVSLPANMKAAGLAIASFYRVAEILGISLCPLSDKSANGQAMVIRFEGRYDLTDYLLVSSQREQRTEIVTSSRKNVYILGPSGVGKSTWGNLITGGETFEVGHADHTTIIPQSCDMNRGTGFRLWDTPGLFDGTEQADLMEQHMDSIIDITAYYSGVLFVFSGALPANKTTIDTLEYAKTKFGDEVCKSFIAIINDIAPGLGERRKETYIQVLHDGGFEVSDSNVFVASAENDTGKVRTVIREKLATFRYHLVRKHREIYNEIIQSSLDLNSIVRQINEASKNELRALLKRGKIETMRYRSEGPRRNISIPKDVIIFRQHSKGYFMRKLGIGNNKILEERTVLLKGSAKFKLQIRAHLNAEYQVREVDIFLAHVLEKESNILIRMSDAPYDYELRDTRKMTIEDLRNEIETKLLPR